MSGERFNFASGNTAKVLALPKFALAAVMSRLVRRRQSRWAFGSGSGVGEGALAVAKELQATDPHAEIYWLCGSESEMVDAANHGFIAVPRRGWAGFMATLRAEQLVVTHGFGDVNRFGVFGGKVINLIHGSPLKRLHLDSGITTSFAGPALLRGLLTRMYKAGTARVSLLVAGSVTAAERLRSAYQLPPGKVQVLGDPRDDQLAAHVGDTNAQTQTRATVRALLGLPNTGDAVHEPLVLYAPTWRDGGSDPAVPTVAEIKLIHHTLQQLGARLVVRSHPLGGADYDALLGDLVTSLPADSVRDITPLLSAFEAVITDYSSLAIDFALLGRPIVWFAPDLGEYQVTRGLYEPLEVTAAGHVQSTWQQAMQQLAAVLPSDGVARQASLADTRALVARFHAHPAGGAAARVVAAIKRLSLPDNELVQPGSVFFESFYGAQATCNPLAIDAEIAKRLPHLPRYWSVKSELVNVPEGAVPLLVGSCEWHAARRTASLLVVNDWLRFNFKRGKQQTVLQTWHGTMLKHLALGRPKVSLRTRLAIKRESRRWSLLLSQNPHSTAQFRSSYAFDGEILELGYPRDDRLAAAVVGDKRIDIAVKNARRVLGVPADAKVLAYLPTWREGLGTVDILDTTALAAELGESWWVITRGHTRSGATYDSGHPQVLDASAHPDVNDVLLAADMLVTDYSSVMFDAAVARLPMLFFVPDLTEYRDSERGFTFDFAATAPGPLLTTRSEVVAHAQQGVQPGASYEAWCKKYLPHEDGHAAARVVDALFEHGALHDA